MKATTIIENRIEVGLRTRECSMQMTPNIAHLHYKHVHEHMQKEVDHFYCKH